MSRPIGLFGGTFDPVHNGHLRLAQTALDALGLESVRWIPAGRPGHRNAPVASAEHRVAMLKLALQDRSGFTLDKAEAYSDSAGFTIDTLRRVRAQTGPAVPLVFLIGADQLLAFDQWREWKQLLELAHFAVTQRPGHDISANAMSAELSQEYARRLAGAGELAARPAGLICSFTMAPLDISSTAIRNALAGGNEPGELLPARVLDYIRSHGLYPRTGAAS